MAAAPGLFVTFEGGEGAGKSTQIRLLAAALRERGLTVLMTREPGGSRGAEAVRHVLLSGAAEAYGIRGLPTSLMIDPEGYVVGFLEGPVDWASPEGLDLVRFYLPQAPQPTPT